MGFPAAGAVQTSAPPPGPPSDEARALTEPPVGLPESQQKLWRELANLAIEQRTLVPATVPGFRELCQLMAFKEDLADGMARFGASGARLKEYARLSPRVDAALARFKLTAFGKPADGGAKTKTSMNPFERVAGQ